MSVNFNVAMLRNLQQPIEDSLETCISQLSQYLAGTLSPENLDAVQHIHLAAGSLTVIGCQAAARVAVALEDAMDGLSRPDRRGWDSPKSMAVAKATINLTRGLLDHLRELLLDNEDLPVRMWPAWQALTLAMEAPERHPEDLFEPDSNFEDLRFAHLADDYLKDVTDGMVTRLEGAIDELASAGSSTEVASALQSALKVFDWAYGLRHGRGYQAYWLALRARLSIGLLGEPESLEDRGEWNILLKEALLEVHKFARNSRRVHPDLLMKTIRPMLFRWPSHWVGSHPTLAEADRRLGFREFWLTLDGVSKEAASGVELLAQAQSDDQVALLSQLKQGWTVYVSGEGADPRLQMSKDLALFQTRRSSFTDPALAPLIDELLHTGSELSAPGAIPEEIALEFATALLLVDDAIERRFRPSTSSDAQLALQAKRLHAARVNLAKDLQQLPKVRWDSKKQERQLRVAHAAIFAEIQKDIQQVEDALAEQLRDEHSKPDIQQLRSTAALASSVLRLLECHAASDVVDSLAKLIGETTDEAISALTLGVASLSAFLTARENGDHEAEHLLDAAYRMLMGRQLPSGSLSEDEWRRTQKPIEEYTDVDTGSALVSIEDAGLSGGVANEVPVQPDGVVQAVETDEQAADQVELVEIAPAQPPSFKREDVFAEGGYREQRSGSELEEFFLEEMDQVLSEIHAQRDILKQNPGDLEARATLRRQFHTIKGSGRLAGFLGLGELGYLLENRLDQDIESSPSYSKRIDILVEQATNQLSLWFSRLNDGQDIDIDGQLVQDWLAQSLVDETKIVAQEGVVQDETGQDVVVGADTTSVAPEENIPEPVSSEATSESSQEITSDPASLIKGGDQEAAVESGVSSPWPPIQTADNTEAVSDAMDPTASLDESSMFVDVEGFGTLDRDTYDLLVQDLARFRDPLLHASSVLAGESIEMEPIHRSAHTAGSLGASLGMSELQVLGRAFELYVEKLSADQESWTELGQDAAEALWLMIDGIIDRQIVEGVAPTLIDRLSDATLITPVDASAFENEAVVGVSFEFDGVDGEDASDTDSSPVTDASIESAIQNDTSYAPILSTEADQEELPPVVDPDLHREGQPEVTLTPGEDAPSEDITDQSTSESGSVEGEIESSTDPAQLLSEDELEQDSQAQSIEVSVSDEDMLVDEGSAPPPSVSDGAGLEGDESQSASLLGADFVYIHPFPARPLDEAVPEASSSVADEDAIPGLSDTDADNKQEAEGVVDAPELTPVDNDQDDDVIGEDQLWETLFESLATVSSELRRIGPILAQLAERRR